MIQRSKNSKSVISPYLVMFYLLCLFSLHDMSDLTVTWFLLVGDAITHYKTETQDYYVWDMGKMNQIDKLMENVSVSDESDW